MVKLLKLNKKEMSMNSNEEPNGTHKALLVIEVGECMSFCPQGDWVTYSVLRVPGGWIYKWGSGKDLFVPEPQQVIPTKKPYLTAVIGSAEYKLIYALSREDAIEIHRVSKGYSKDKVICCVTIE
jgi:hypothetical protein